MLVHLYEIIAQHSFGTPRIEPGYVIPIIRAAWPQLAESQVTSTPVPLGRVVDPGDEWDRLRREYGIEAVTSVYANPAMLKQRMDEEAELIRELRLTCNEQSVEVNKPLFKVDAVKAPSPAKVRRRRGVLVAE